MAMNTDSIPTLYSFALSPFALKVRAYLLYKQQPFQTQYVNPGKMREELPIGHAVPVLSYGDESRNESSQIGLWLDELFPDAPQLLPQDIAQEPILQADEWVSMRLMPALFRIGLGVNVPLSQRLRQRWSASEVLRQTSPEGFSWWRRVLHALLVHKAPFIQRLVAQTDMSVSDAALREQLSQEFVEMLADGPFLCGSQAPTLADCSAFPAMITGYLRGDRAFFLPGADVVAWVQRMKPFFPDLAQLLPPELCQRSVEDL